MIHCIPFCKAVYFIVKSRAIQSSSSPCRHPCAPLQQPFATIHWFGQHLHLILISVWMRSGPLIEPRIAICGQMGMIEHLFQFVCLASGDKGQLGRAQRNTNCQLFLFNQWKYGTTSAKQTLLSTIIIISVQQKETNRKNKFNYFR